MIPIILVTQSLSQAEKYIKKTYPKVFLTKLEPEKTEYTINQIREIISETKYETPELRIYFLPFFEKSSLEAQNAFLKILEEPPKNVLFILNTSNQFKLIPTIVSRSKVVNYENKPSKSKELSQSDIYHLIIRRQLKILSSKEVTVTNKEQAVEVVKNIITSFKKHITEDRHAAKVLNEGLSVLPLIENNNLSPQLAIDHLLIFIVKQYSIK